MGKKRVHEIAKEMGMESKVLLDKLNEAGLDVRSHASTVDDDDVKRALGQSSGRSPAPGGGVILRRKAADTPAGDVILRRPPASAGGEVILRRGKTDVPAPAATPATARAAGGVILRGTPTETPVEAQSEPAQVEAPRAEPKPEPAVETTPAVQAAEPSVEQAPAPTETPAPVVAEATAAADASAAAVAPSDTATPTPDPATADETTAAAGEDDPPVRGARATDDEDDDSGTEDERRERREARMARPDRVKREEPADEDDEKPEMTMEDLGLSELDFAADSAARQNQDARVAPPPPSTKPAAMAREEEPASKVVRRIDPALLKARLAGDKRPEPPKEWKPDIPASPVTELVVRTDASGKRRELVDVRKEAAKGRGPGGRDGRKRREEMSAKDLLEHRRGQVYYPTPNRRRTKGKPKVARRPDAAMIANRGPVEIGETITVADLAKQMSVKATDIIRALMRGGVMATMNQPIDHDTAAEVAMEFGYEVSSTLFEEEALLAGESISSLKRSVADDPDAVLRAPVVTVMGHVDHGKTSLLDRIRNANVASGEAGGITQAIAGYQVSTSKGLITFLDTPGHKAFTAMRARGANITDIVVLVVAADDGVMPQTLEAIEHAKAAAVPVIVAINKCDKPEANPDRVLQQLSTYGILTEDWGGDVLSRKISAKTGEGVEELLELIALQSEIMELRSNPTIAAVGHVVEAEIHKGRGPVATVLVQQGTLKVGDAIIAGEAIGKVRALINDQGRRVKEAGPAVPIQILGLNGVPAPGDEMRVAKSLDDARQLAAHRTQLRRETELAGTAKVSLQDLFTRMQSGEQKELRIIIKADVQGSVEALRGALVGLTNNQVRVNVIHGGVGAITESDVEFASASEAIIVGFGVRPDTQAIKASRALGGVDFRTHSVIYEAVDEVRLAMQGLLAPVTREKYLGRAEIRQTFSVPRVGTVAGCAVVDGVVARSSQIRVLRDSREIYNGRLSSLKRFKEDVREVKEGFECGMGVERFNDLKVGDIIEAYEIEQVAAVLDDSSSASEARI